MFKFLEPYRLIIEIALGILAFVWAADKVHEFRERDRETGRNEIRQQWDKAEKAAKAAADAQKQQWDANTTKAQVQGDEREKNISRLIAANTAASNGLRDITTAIRDGVPTATIETLRQTTTTLATVFRDCQGRYVEMAGIADKHANDAKTLSDAWPVATPAADVPPPK